jgi:hypothetical protein
VKKAMPDDMHILWVWMMGMVVIVAGSDVEGWVAGVLYLTFT